MTAHQVRRLRCCEVCGRLVDKDDMTERYGEVCIRCAWRRCGSTVTAFTTMYPRHNWDRLPLDLIGADAMNALLVIIRERMGDELERIAGKVRGPR